MVVLLIEESTDVVRFCLLPNKQCTIGRTGGKVTPDVNLAGDESVSRSHAKIFDNNSTKLQITDLSSYGTFVNEKRIPKNVASTLSNNDRIRCGATVLRVKIDQFTVLTSTISPDEKVSLSEILMELGGIIVVDFDDTVTHLCSTKAKLTTKTVLCLIRAIPIITYDYFKSYLEWTKNPSEIKPPDCQNFVPEVIDKIENPDEVDLSPDSKRSTLFDGLTFFFWSRSQHNKLCTVISAAGGISKVMELSDQRCLLNSGSCVMKLVVEKSEHSVNEEMRNLYSQISRLLKGSGKRSIGDSEIVKAILFASTDHFCNPSSIVDSSSQMSQTFDALPPIQPMHDLGALVGDRGLKRKIVPDSVTVNQENSPDSDVRLNESFLKRLRLSSDAEIIDKQDEQTFGKEAAERMANAVLKAESAPFAVTVEIDKSHEEAKNVDIDVKFLPENSLNVANVAPFVNGTSVKQESGTPLVVDVVEKEWRERVTCTKSKDEVVDDAERKCFERVRRNCVQVSEVPLTVKEDDRLAKVTKVRLTNGLNFKRFKKSTEQLKPGFLPTIIGGSDFVVYGERAPEFSTNSFVGRMNLPSSSSRLKIPSSKEPAAIDGGGASSSNAGMAAVESSLNETSSSSISGKRSKKTAASIF